MKENNKKKKRSDEGIIEWKKEQLNEEKEMKKNGKI